MRVMKLFLVPLLCLLLSSRLSQIQVVLKQIDHLDKQVQNIQQHIKVHKDEIADSQPFVDIAKDTWPDSLTKN